MMYETRDLGPSDEPMMGPLSQWDRVDEWIDVSTLAETFDIHPDATIAHVLSMQAFNDSLAHGDKQFEYDAQGEREIDALLPLLDSVVAQDADRLGIDARAAKDRLFERLGFQHSSWDADTLAVSWVGSLLDMARLGLVVLNGGMYDGERLLDVDFVYNMTHAAFEDGSRRYGYLTWLSDHACAPRAVHAEYPHGLSEATDCEEAGCAQDHDVGIWSMVGYNGQYVLGHRGLDLLLITKDWYHANGNSELVWDTLRPALVAADPVFEGDDEAFCEAYRSGSYAPDLKKWEGNR
jgi:hypothetical protein